MREQRVAIDLHTGGMQRDDRITQHLVCGPAPVETGNPRTSAAGGAACKPDEHGRGTNLQSRRDAQGFKRTHTMFKPHGLPRVIAPVLGRRRGRHRRAGEVGNPRQTRRLMPDARSGLHQSGQRRLDQRTVKRVTRHQPRRRQIVGLTPRHEGVQRRVWTGDHDLRGGVESRDVDRQVRHQCGGAIDVCRHGDHAAGQPERIHQASACGDQVKSVFETEYAGHPRRGKLADAVTNHRGGLRPARLPQRRECTLHHVQGGLRDTRTCEHGVVVG